MRLYFSFSQELFSPLSPTGIRSQLQGYSYFYLSSGGDLRPFSVYFKANVTNDEWHHIAITFNGEKLDYYLDGNKVYTTSYFVLNNEGKEVKIPLHQLRFENINGDGFVGGNPSLNSFFNGLMDEFKIYATNLEENQIKQLYLDRKDKIEEFTIKNIRTESKVVNNLDSEVAGRIYLTIQQISSGNQPINQNIFFKNYKVNLEPYQIVNLHDLFNSEEININHPGDYKIEVAFFSQNNAAVSSNWTFSVV